MSIIEDIDKKIKYYTDHVEKIQQGLVLFNELKQRVSEGEKAEDILLYRGKTWYGHYKAQNLPGIPDNDLTLKPRPEYRPYENLDEARAALKRTIVSGSYDYEVIGISDTKIICRTMNNVSGRYIGDVGLHDFRVFNSSTYRFKDDNSRVGILK